MITSVISAILGAFLDFKEWLAGFFDIKGWIVDFARWAGERLPEISQPPEFIINAVPTIQSLLNTASKLSAWVPFEMVGMVVGVGVAVLLSSLGIKLGRIILSYLTLGGGQGA